MPVIIKSDNEIAIMRKAGRIVAEILALLRDSVRPGMETRELDAIARREIAAYGVESSFLGYPHQGVNDFPATVCVSVNDEIVHGIPGKRVLREGDLVKLDFGVVYRGFHGDSAITVCVGKPTPLQQRLMDVTRQSLEEGIRAAQPGRHIGDIGAAIQGYVERHGFSVVRKYVGHGIGRQLHEDPQVPNYGEPGKGELLRPGMTIAIEPMVNVGQYDTKEMKDGWTIKTRDGGLSAHYEHTIAIRHDGPEVLTLAAG